MSGLMISVLGPVRVTTPAGDVDLGGRRPQKVLGALVMGVGHTVSMDHLVDVVWGDDPPDHAVNTVQSYVSRLRHVLGPDAIRSIEGGYLLDVGADELDALIFERLVRNAREESDPERVRASSREALRLWRGVPFGDLSREDPFRLEAVRLDELRLLAI